MIEIISGQDKGRYPDGNALVVRGTSETALVDPSLTVAAHPPAGIDRVFISHCHEDHLAGLHRFPAAAVHVHERDRLGLESLDGLMQIYGMAPEIASRWRLEVVERFNYVPRPDAIAYRDGAAFDLGGTKVHVIHLPGHTRGHSGFFIEPDGAMFLADVDLTGFGPYYGDAWSSLDEFDRTIERCREIDAAVYVTFHHKGTIHSRAELLKLLDEYQAVITRREEAMLAFLREPRTIDDMVAHRFVYRPHVTLLFADAVERRSAQLHLARLLDRDLVTELEPGRFVVRVAPR